ncbi:Uncharacterised protein [uncultured archaeon]|nr:Uncharacterised protein [uncultured archaeon]
MIKRANKRGWIRIVEAFIAVLLVTGVLLILINQGYLGKGKSDYSAKIYDAQIAVLREIQIDSTLRAEILNVNPIPVSSDQTGLFPVNVLKKINDRITEYQYLNCTASICGLDKICPQPDTTNKEKDVYAQGVAISAEPNLPEFSPRQLKLFCWTK